MPPSSAVLRRRIAAATLVAAMALLSGCSGSTDGLFGKELFERTCASCHGNNGEGSVARPAINAGTNAVTLSDEQIRGIIEVGPGAMPSFSRLSDDQIDSLVAYVRELQGQAPDDG